MIRTFGLSDTGRVRKSNEDFFAIDDQVHLAVLADGMGGHSAGEVASRLAVEAFVAFVRRSAETDDLTWPYGIETALSFEANVVKTGIQLANRRVFRAAESRDDYTGMGTTMVGTIVSGDRLVVGHVGDSRLYLLRNGALMQVTQDDSWAAQILADEFAANPALATTHPMRNVLTNVLGAREETEVHVQELKLEPGALVLISSDGLHGVLKPDAICGLMSSGNELEVMARKLIDVALDAGSRDNVTVILMKYDG